MSDLEGRVRDLEKAMNEIHTLLGQIQQAIGELKGAQNTTVVLVKWVITPMLILLAALVGIKLALPGS